MEELLKKLFALNPTPNMSGFRFADLFDNNRWETLQRDSYSPKRGELAVEGDPFSGVSYRQYVPREAYAEPSVLEDAAPQFVPSPDAAGVYPEFDMLPEPIVPVLTKPNAATATGMMRNVPRLSAPEIKRLELLRRSRPTGTFTRGPIALHDESTPRGRFWMEQSRVGRSMQQGNEFARRMMQEQARRNLRSTPTRPPAFKPEFGKGGLLERYKPYEGANRGFTGGGGFLKRAAGFGLPLFLQSSDAGAQGMDDVGYGDYDPLAIQRSLQNRNTKRVTTETPDGKTKVVTTEEIDPIADQNTWGMETAPQFNYVPEPGEIPVQRDQYGNLYNYSMTDAQRDAVNEMRRTQQFEQAENYDDSDFSLMEYAKRLLKAFGVD